MESYLGDEHLMAKLQPTAAIGRFAVAGSPQGMVMVDTRTGESWFPPRCQGGGYGVGSDKGTRESAAGGTSRKKNERCQQPKRTRFHHTNPKPQARLTVDLAWASG